MLALPTADLAAGLAGGGSPPDLAAQQAERHRRADGRVHPGALPLRGDGRRRVGGRGRRDAPPPGARALGSRRSVRHARVRRTARGADRCRAPASGTTARTGGPGSAPRKPRPRSSGSGRAASRSGGAARLLRDACWSETLPASCGSGASHAVPPVRPPSSGHSPANTPQVHSKPGTVQSCSIQMSSSGTLCPPGRRALLRAHGLGPDDHAGVVEAQPAVEVVLVPAVVRTGEALGRTTRVEHQVAEPDDLRVRGGAVEQQLRRGRRVERTGERRCSCSAHRCRARTRWTCGTPRPRPPRPSGTSRRHRARSSARPGARCASAWVTGVLLERAAVVVTFGVLAGLALGRGWAGALAR